MSTLWAHRNYFCCLLKDFKHLGLIPCEAAGLDTGINIYGVGIILLIMQIRVTMATSGSKCINCCQEKMCNLTEAWVIESSCDSNSD